MDSKIKRSGNNNTNKSLSLSEVESDLFFGGLKDKEKLEGVWDSPLHNQRRLRYQLQEDIDKSGTESGVER